MGERKVLNKFYPPDFDPAKLQKPKNPAERQDKVRMMLPFTVRCSTCGTFLHIGTKFNMRKETIQDEDYLGIPILRFFFKCSRCATEITMKTDPRNSDYVCESGASRNYDEWRDLDAAEEALKAVKKDEDEDPMKFLESKTYDSRREMEILNALDEIRQINKIQAKVDHEGVMRKIAEIRKKEAEIRDGAGKLEESPGKMIKRVDEDEADIALFRKHRRLLETEGKQRQEVSTVTSKEKERVDARPKMKVVIRKKTG